MPARRPALALLALLVAGGALAACGDDGEDETGDVPDDAVVIDGATASVQALDNTFRAADIQVQPGTSVTWTNEGRNEHDVLPAEGDAWGIEVEEFQPGDSYEHTFTEPGVYHYYCSIHGTTTAGMVGSVTVADE